MTDPIQPHTPPPNINNIDMESGVSERLGETFLYKKPALSLSASNTKITVSWQDISYSIQPAGCFGVSGEPVSILKGLSGVVNPGEMLAIIGGSGAGKSTLLDILAQRKSTGEITGSVKFNGSPGASLKNLLRRLTGYVTQEDILKGSLTVRETLQFYAELRLDPSEFTDEQRVARVEKVMTDLEILHRADALVGSDEIRGLSGGEKKRVAIGVQLVTDPPVLYLDEPTSGLDAYNSLKVLRLLQVLCQNGKTVITTIHQPRSTIYKLFDKLLILNRGSSVYFGSASDALSYFSDLGYPVPLHINPADFFIDVLLSPDRTDFALDTAMPADIDFVASFSKSEQAAVIASRVSQCNCKDSFEVDLMLIQTIKPFATGVFKQYVELLGRNFKDLMRNPVEGIVGIVLACVMSLIFGSIFYQLGNSQSAIQGRIGVLFFVLVNGAFSLAQAVATYIIERHLTTRERAAGVYSAGPYFLAKASLEIPMHIIQPIIFGSIMYWMSGLNMSAVRYFTYIAIVILNSIVAGSVYSCIGAVAPNPVVGNILAPVVTVLFFLFAGYFISANAIPNWWIWVYYWSWFHYSFQALMVNEFQGEIFTCDGGVSATCTSTGDQVLINYGMSTVTPWHWIMVLIGMAVGYRILAFLAVKYLQKEQR